MKASFFTMLLPALTITPANAATLNFKTTSAFAGAHQPSSPQAGFIALQGALYGTSLTGGTHGYGTVFKLIPGAAFGTKATVQVLCNFGASSADGRNPDAPLASDSAGAAGTLYGTALNGGQTCPTTPVGCGTVFALTPPAASGGTWSGRAIFSFSGGADGALPVSGVALGAGGQLYGTTGGDLAEGGGTTNYGSVFRLQPVPSSPGTFTKTTIHTFANGSDGFSPRSLPARLNNLFFGSTVSGGATGRGTTFVFGP